MYLLDDLTSTLQNRRGEAKFWCRDLSFSSHTPLSNFLNVLPFVDYHKILERLYFATFSRVESQCKNSEIIPCFSSPIPIQGAFHFPMENKGKESCCGHFPVLVGRRPLFFTSQEYRAVPLVGLNFGKTGLILNQHRL